MATNAGGSRAVRHGVMRHHIRAIEAILTTGETLSLGGRIHKDNVGYDLMQLIIGSEATLAVITKATLQLYPKSGVTMTMIVPYDERSDALSSVPEVLENADTPLAIEYVERDLMEKSAKHLGARWPVTAGKCHLIIIVSEPSDEQVLTECQKIAEICHRHTTYEPYAAKSKGDQDNILRIRSNIYLALKKETMDILDITVPIATLEKVIRSIQEVANKQSASLALFGHAGDGNLHVHIMRKESQSLEDVDKLRNKIYQIARTAGGVITGEHGVGKIRIKKAEECFAARELELMRSIKKTFDPNGILNPGTKISD